MKQPIRAGTCGNIPLFSMLCLYACGNRNNGHHSESLFRTCFRTGTTRRFRITRKPHVRGFGNIIFSCIWLYSMIDNVSVFTGLIRVTGSSADRHTEIVPGNPRIVTATSKSIHLSYVKRLSRTPPGADQTKPALILIFFGINVGFLFLPLHETVIEPTTANNQGEY